MSDVLVAVMVVIGFLLVVNFAVGELTRRQEKRRVKEWQEKALKDRRR